MPVDNTVLFLRVTLWEYNYDPAFKFKIGTYYYTDSVAVPDYKCDVFVIIEQDKWILEE